MSSETAVVRVERSGPSALIQDRGRATGPDEGVATSGAFDQRAYDLANRLVGLFPTWRAVEQGLRQLSTEFI